VLIFSDAHFSLKHLEAASNSLYRVVDISHQLRAEGELDAVFFLGDLFDSRVLIHAKVFSKVCSILNLFDLPVMAIAGNHDFYSEDVDCILNYLPNMQVVTEPCILKEDPHVYMVPWCKELPKIPDFTKIIFGHFDVDVKYAGYKGNMSVKSLLKKGIEKVFLGHVHKPGEPTHKIEYVGPTFRTSFGEEHITPRCILFDTETLEQQSYELPSPKYYTAKYGEFDPLKEMYVDHVRVMVPRGVSPKEAAEKYKNCELIFEKTNLDEVRKSASERMSDEELVRLYVENNPLEGVPPEELLQFGIDIIKEATDAKGN